MFCAWHPDEPKRPGMPIPLDPEPREDPGCMCNPVTNTCGPDWATCALLYNHGCNPMNGHADCEIFRRADDFETNVVKVVEESASEAPPMRSPVVGGKRRPRPPHHEPPKTCDDDEDVLVRPAEPRDRRPTDHRRAVT